MEYSGNQNNEVGTFPSTGKRGKIKTREKLSAKASAIHCVSAMILFPISVLRE
jgi:hypothetical protein